MSSFFAAAQSNVIHLHNAYNIFMNEGVLELDLLPCDKIQDGAVKIYMSFSLSNLSAFVQKNKNKWVDRISTKPKGKFFMEFTLSLKYSRKCNRLSWS